MAEIRILPVDIADKIAAGEVAERPSAVVKELVENSIDAGATSIEVEIKNGGIEYIRVTDNGCGIPPSQAEIAFMRHATSKLRQVEDLYNIGTMGFRGEALASICAVAEVELITKTKDNDEGCFLRLERGKVCENSPIACGDGTVMVVKHLFENIPARMKFLKKNSTEAGYVADILGRMALSRPDIAFEYICDDKEVFSTTGDGKLENVVLKLYGVEHAKSVIPVYYKDLNAEITGLIGKPQIARGNRSRQTLFVNGRYVKSAAASKIVAEGYRNTIMRGKFPFFVLNINVPANLVDVNVHPAKTEVKFAEEKEVYSGIYRAVSSGIKEGEEPASRLKEMTEDLSQKMSRGKGVGGVENKYITEKIDKETVKEYLNTFKDKEENTPKTLSDETFGVNVSYDKPVGIFDIKNTETGGASFDDVVTLNQNEEEKKDYPGAWNFKNDLKDGRVKTCGQTSMYTEIETSDTKAEKLKEDDSKENDGSAFEFPEESFDLQQKNHIIGQVFDTYVLCTKGSVLYMIDQHAAHERHRFEKLKKDYYSKNRMSQILLAPIILKLDYKEAQTVLANLEEYEKFGFEIEDFGTGSVIVNATPIIADEKEITDLVLEIAEAIENRGRYTVADYEEALLDMIACKYAIKANKKLNFMEMQKVVDITEELETKGIKSCPHGRPIKIQFTKEEIEKLFKRRL